MSVFCSVATQTPKIGHDGGGDREAGRRLTSFATTIILTVAAVESGQLVFHAVFVNLRRFALKLLPVGLVAGLLLWLALVILRGLIVHFELFHHRVLYL